MSSVINVLDVPSSIKELEENSVVIIKELIKIPAIIRSQGFSKITNYDTGPKSGYFYTRFICYSINIYLANNFPSREINANFDAYHIEEGKYNNCIFFCVQLKGDFDSLIRNKLEGLVNKLRSDTTIIKKDLFSKELDSDLKYNENETKCLKEVVNDFLAKNSSRDINNNFSVGFGLDDDKQIPVKSYVEYEVTKELTIEIEGIALQNGFIESDNQISLIVFSGEDYSKHEKVFLSISDVKHIDVLIESRIQNKKLKFKAYKKQSVGRPDKYELRALEIIEDNTFKLTN
ncbi:hypothetical protein [Marinospirillum minutulum]|uniref:hypothetical protein n=1 Tax=Marinospirillum minutulum TaxID=64974 RepID=UPI0004084CD1|nr:hypothetical protein [Marinospirillum minutulum]